MCIIEKESLTLDDLMDYLIKKKSNEILKMNRVKKLYHDDKSFDQLMNQIIEKDIKRFENLINKKSNQHDVTRIFYTILDIVQADGKEIDPPNTLAKILPSRTILYKGWTFSWIHGKGTVISIYNRDNELIYRF